MNKLSRVAVGARHAGLWAFHVGARHAGDKQYSAWVRSGKFVAGRFVENRFRDSAGVPPGFSPAWRAPTIPEAFRPHGGLPRFLSHSVFADANHRR